MPLSIGVRLVLDRFEGATGHDPDGTTWPPSPARLFAALVAAGPIDEGARRALEWLESRPAPEIRAVPEELCPPGPSRRFFVPTAEVDPKGGSHQSHPGRIALGRTRARCFPRHPELVYVWAEDPEPQVVGALELLARRVPYLGRATSPAVVTVGTEPPEPADDRVRLEPRERPATVGDVELAVPYPGFLDDLDLAHETGEPFDHPVTRWYGTAPAADGAPPPAGPSPGPWRELVLWRLPTGLRLPGQLALRLTGALRRAVLGHLGTGVSPVITGHLPAAPHCGWLALPFVGHPHADGHLMGLALALPDTLAGPDRGSLAVAVDGLDRLEVPGVGGVDLERVGAGAPAWSLQRQRWVGPARRWVTAIPAELDLYPRRRLTVEEVVVRACRFAGLPEPLTVRAGTAPMLAGAVGLRPRHLRRKGGRIRPYRHLELTFAEPVAGPVAVGAKRNFGLGLCVPADDLP